MKKYIALLLMFMVSFSFAQEVNQYKYALIPSKFNFLKDVDQYQLNSLTKFLMEKQGFVVFLDTDENMPEEIMLSNCNKIYVDVLSEGNFMVSKLSVVLKDCKGKILFTSEQGKSKEKDYKKGFQEALRNAFNSFSSLHYFYTPTENQSNATATPVVKQAVVVAPVFTTPAVTAAVVNPANDVKPVQGTFKNDADLLFAQPITNGFQLIDTTPKVVMKIYNTSVKNTYTAVKASIQGVFILKDNQWFFEYYKDDNLVSEKINVKF